MRTGRNHPRPRISKRRSALATRCAGSPSSPRLIILVGLGLLSCLLGLTGPTYASDQQHSPESTKRLAAAVAKRAAVMKTVAELKFATDRPIYDAARERAILDRIRAAADDDHVEAELLFAQIQMDLAKQLQAAWMMEFKSAKSSAGEDPAYSEDGLSDLRTRLNRLGDDVSRSLRAVRQADDCDPKGLHGSLHGALSELNAPLKGTAIDRFALMLAAAACTGIPSH